jgi:hypothetical protein
MCHPQVEGGAVSASDGLAGVLAGGNTRASLVALRDFLARSLEECESKRDQAGLTARLMDVMDRIAALPAPLEGTALDELAQRRASGERVSATAARSHRG